MLDDQKKKQLGILVKIAEVDEDFADSEKEVIRKIAEKYGASESEFDEIISSNNISEGIPPMSITDKMDFMMDCMLVILADDIVTHSEESFANTMASKLGLGHDVVRFLIENKDATREQMKEQMLPYFK
ncbi:MAG: hypothetical protein ACJA08_001239 [Cyclobacteriaceae bacterium]|jgi:hypothetical protein